MKPTALLVDISRAGVVNRQDLADALKAGRLAGAAMDFCDPLPVSFRRAAAMSVENILNYFREPSHIVNPDALKVSRPRLQPSR